MKKSVLILYFTIIILPVICAQKVGLVLSGGGARGITHIGVLKALEENNIPIDYVAGTSMGAIVGSLYAMGYSPEEMLSIVKSTDFKYWASGDIEPDYVYYYHCAEAKPNFMEMKLRKDDKESLNLKISIFPTNILSPRQLNYAFVPLFAQANAVCKGNFDSLFIPFRCVASDIYKKETVIFRRGVLGDAIRASMTFPFMIKPITIGDQLLFDGGIYNNFPVNVMRDDFNPDFILGSVVSRNPDKPNEQDVVSHFENMIMNHTNYDLLPSEGVVLKFDLKYINTFDFSKVDETVKMGYDSVIKHLPEIKARMPRTVPNAVLIEKRKAFRSRFPALKFHTVVVDGVDSIQKKYVENVFLPDSQTFDIEEFKRSYFKLIADDKISEVIPHALYNPSNGMFDLTLTVKADDDLKVLIGGNVSSSSSNQVYFGLTYQKLNHFAQKTYFDTNIGRMYNSVGFGSRIEFPSQKKWFLKFALLFHKLNYFDGNGLFYENELAANISQYENYSKLSVGFPVTMKGRFEIGIGGAFLTDYYSQNNSLSLLSGERDKSSFTVGSVFARIESNTLNHYLYPIRGGNYSSSFQVFGAKEKFKSSSNLQTDTPENVDIWLQYRAKITRFYALTPNFSLGIIGEVALSNRNLLQNYKATVTQASSFQPTPHSRTIFSPAFCANQFVAIGLVPIFNVTTRLQLRNETYSFIPYKTFIRLSDNSAAYSQPFQSVEFLNETSLVFDFRIATAAMYLNYYSSGVNRWNFGVNIGFLLFNPKFME